MRLFIAIPLPEKEKQILSQCCEQMKEQQISGRWVPQANYHVTLAFLGEVEDPAPVIAVLEKLEVPALELCFEGALRFGPLLALRLEKNETLESLVNQLRNQLKEAGISFDEKPFKGHVTLVRKMQNPDQVPIELPQFCIQADRVCLMRSIFEGGSVRYEPLFCKGAE